MKRYCLSPHAHCCLTDEGVVLLDLKGHKYLGLSTSESHGLENIILRWPSAQCVNSPAMDDHGGRQATSTDELVQQLIQQDLIRPARGENLPKAIHAPPPRAALDESYDLDGTGPRYSALHVVRFLRACLMASALLRTQSMEHIVSRVRTRRDKTIHSNPNGVGDDQVRFLASVFRHLRPFLFTGADRCLFDSLALLEFFARFQMHPFLVFGVRARPFAAHCWVQSHELVLNSPIELAKRFTPILVV